MKKAKGNQVKVFTYYFPNYHRDAHNEKVHGEGWTEWELLKNAKPRFDGHYQPKVPLWGYEDESNPEVMEKKIKAAKEYGIDCFIFDAYFYENENYLSGCLDDGFLKAKNSEDIEFALMWANHTWANIHPAKLGDKPEEEFNGVISPKAFKRITGEIIDKYFTKKNYCKVGGKPYFSIYAVDNLLKTFGGIDGLNKAIKEFREDARKVVGEIHINAVVGEISLLPTENIDNGFKTLNALDFDSYSSYCWLHHYEMPDFPKSSYKKCAKYYLGCLKDIPKQSTKPYYPNVSVGWDASPRTVQSIRFVKSDYPYTPILDGNTPELFGKYLKKAIKYTVKHNEEPIVTINAWNEWTEGAYLEPDEKYGYAYLEKIREIKAKRADK